MILKYNHFSTELMDLHLEELAMEAVDEEVGGQENNTVPPPLPPPPVNDLPMSLPPAEAPLGIAAGPGKRPRRQRRGRE